MLPVHEQITQAREAHGWLIKELAEKAGLSDTGVARIEAGIKDVKLSTLLKLSKATGIAFVIGDETKYMAENIEELSKPEKFKKSQMRAYRARRAKREQ